MDWYLRQNDQQIGPLDESALRAMAAAGKIDARTLLWRPGLAQWVAAEKIPGIVTPPPAPESPSSAVAPPTTPAPAQSPSAAASLQGERARATASPVENAPTATDRTIARPWPRYWARMIDIWLEVAVLSFILGLLSPSLFQSGAILDSDGPLKNLTGLLLLPVAMIADAVVYTFLGNSLGKAILGIRVRHTEGARLSFGTYSYRNFQAYIHGLGIGFPLISLFTLLSSHRRASRLEPLSWDTGSNSRPYSDAGGARTVFGALCFFAVVAGIFAVGEYAKENPEPRITSTSLPSPVHPASTAATATVAASPTMAVAGPPVASSVTEQLQSAAAELNKDGPRKVNPTTRFDSASVGPGLTFNYAYTLLNATGPEWDREVTRRAIIANRPNVINSVCGSGVKTMLDAGVTAQYRYSAKDGSLITTVAVRSSDCPVQ